MASFLGIESSLTCRRWVGPGTDLERRAEALAQQTALPGPLCQVLARRGIAPEEANDFLSPTLRDLLPDPLTLKDMETAAARIRCAAELTLLRA